VAALDRLTGEVASAARLAQAPPEAPRAEQPAPGDSGPGCRFTLGGPEERCFVHRDDHGWIACIGSPYDVDGEPDLRALCRAPVARLEAALAALGGEFVLARFDARERALVLATDRFATIPLFYAITADGLAFGTDLAWVAQRLTPPAGVDPQAIYDYLFYSVVPGSRTIRRGVRKLPACSVLVFHDGRLRSARYWQPDFDRPASADGDLRERAFEAISRATRRAAARPGFGCFLSGGLDSSSVAGLAARHAQAPVHAFTMGFDVPDFDESRYARISAEHFGLVLHEKCVQSADVSACIDAVVGAHQEPFGNASAVSAYLCARLARETGMSRLLAGDGGDELFGGNERYQKQAVFELYAGLPRPLRLAVDPLAAASRFAPAPLSKLWSYVEQARVPLPDRLFSYNLLVRNPPASVLTAEFLETVDTLAPYEYARGLYREPAAGDALDRMLYLDWALTLTDNDLPKVKVACDLAGVAVHFPMLDPEVVQISTRVPSSQKLTLRELRKFYKDAFRGFLPDAVIAKRKHGFGVPVGIWINADAQLRERVSARLRSLARRNVVRADFIDDLLRRQQSEHATYYGTLTWWLFMLEEWLLANPD
jgi:asparagine synthase (glutamine-hydrolysing)